MNQNVSLCSCSKLRKLVPLCFWCVFGGVSRRKTAFLCVGVFTMPSALFLHSADDDDWRDMWVCVCGAVIGAKTKAKTSTENAVWSILFTWCSVHSFPFIITTTTSFWWSESFSLFSWSATTESAMLFWIFYRNLFFLEKLRMKKTKRRLAFLSTAAKTEQLSDVRLPWSVAIDASVDCVCLIFLLNDRWLEESECP